MILIKNIKELIQVDENKKMKISGKEMSHLNTLKNAWLLIKDDLILDFGDDANPDYEGEVIDASGKIVFPSFCDSHTHLVYAGSREIEFIDKIRGLSYEEIANRGGGILNSAKKLHETS